MPPSPPIRSVAIGDSVLAVGVAGGTLITAGTRLSADAETADPRELATALAAEEPPEERRTLGEIAEGSVMTASDATKRVEQAEDLLSAALEGSLLDLDAAPTRAALVLEVLGHLDKNDRYEEWLRYARAVNGLALLFKRWLDLLRVLRTLLRSGDQVHEAGRAGRSTSSARCTWRPAIRPRPRGCSSGRGARVSGSATPTGSPRPSRASASSAARRRGAASPPDALLRSLRSRCSCCASAAWPERCSHRPGGSRSAWRSRDPES